MAEPIDLRERRRDDFLAQTARIAFTELQRYFAAGRLIWVRDDLDLVVVAVELAEDNKAQFQQWLDAGALSGVDDAQAATWLDEERELWAVVADPWVLVQERRSD